MHKKFLFLICIVTVLTPKIFGLSTETYNRIVNLVASNPKQLSIKEYSLIAEKLLEKTPCNMLVFGVGNDSSMWMDLNVGGKTVFLEDNMGWYKLIKAKRPNIQSYLVNYTTTRKEWKSLLKSDCKLLYMSLPDEVLETKWDIIFVDGPAGGNKAEEVPGRMQSIYMASLLASVALNCDVFVHDCNRKIEARYSAAFLQNIYLEREVDRLRHYRIEPRFVEPRLIVPKYSERIKKQDSTREKKTLE